MKKRILSIIHTLLLMLLTNTSFSLAMEGNPPLLFAIKENSLEELCILCVVAKPWQHCEFANLKAHFSKVHQCDSRLVYLCTMCNHSGSARHIKAHFRFKHFLRLSTIKNLEHIRIPFLSANSAIKPEKMKEYSTRLYALLDDQETSDCSYSKSSSGCITS